MAGARAHRLALCLPCACACAWLVLDHLSDLNVQRSQRRGNLQYRIAICMYQTQWVWRLSVCCSPLLYCCTLLCLFCRSTVCCATTPAPAPVFNTDTGTCFRAFSSFARATHSTTTTSTSIPGSGRQALWTKLRRKRAFLLVCV